MKKCQLVKEEEEKVIVEAVEPQPIVSTRIHGRRIGREGEETMKLVGPTRN